MVALALLIGLISVFLYIAYFYYVKPKQQIQDFVKQAQSAGYKVKQYPFKFLQSTVVNLELQQDGNMRVFKEEFKDYDIVVSNTREKMSIIPINVQILKDVFSQLPKLPKSKNRSEAFSLINGGGLICAQGDDWKRKRKIMGSVFHFDFLNQMIPNIEIQIAKQIEKIDKKLQQGQNIFNLTNIFYQILSKVIARIFFGSDLTQYYVQGLPFCQFYAKFLEDLYKFIVSKQNQLLGMTGYKLSLSRLDREIKRKLKIMNQVAKQAILKQVERINNGQAKIKTMVSSLYEANKLQVDESDKDPNKYSFNEFVGQFLIFFTGGIDATGQGINVCLHYLSMKQYSKVTEKILEEIKSISEKKGTERVKSMKYIDSVFSETLRLNGSAGLVHRTAQNNLTLKGLKIKDGTEVYVSSLVNHHSEEHFDNPEEFVPQRWQQEKRISSLVYTTFGAGQRYCIGHYLSRIQAKLVLSSLIQRYQIKALHLIEMKTGIAYKTKHSQYELKKRQQINIL